MASRMPYTQIAIEALPPRLSVIGYVKVGGLQNQIRFTTHGKPWVAPTRYTDPVRFEVTTREQRIEEVKGRGNNADKTFKVGRGYVRDDRIHEIIGAQPEEIDIRLMFPTTAENFICHFGAHDGKRWVCQGNGIEAQDVVRGAVACPCPRLKQFDGKYTGPRFPEGERLVQCKPRGVLSFIIPEAETFGGFYVYKTTSYESIANVRTQLEVFERQFGRLDGLPFRLKVYPATKSYNEGEGTTTQPIVTLVIAAAFDAARQLAAAAAEESRRYLLVAGGAPDPKQHRTILEREMVEEAEAEGQEFHSETAQPTSDAVAGKAPIEDLNARIRARGRGALPVIQAQTEESTDSDGPHYEVLDEPGAEASPAELTDEDRTAIAELEALRDRAVAAGILPETGKTSIAEAIVARNLKTIRAWVTTLKRRVGDQVQPPADAGAPPAAAQDEPVQEAAAPAREEPRGSLTGKTRDELNREYFALLNEARPEWGDVERKLWQQRNVGKHSCKGWDPDDYELAISLVRKGRLEIELPPKQGA